MKCVGKFGGERARDHLTILRSSNAKLEVWAMKRVLAS